MEDQMDQNNGRAGRLLGDYAKTIYNGMQSSVRYPPVVANNFEIKHNVLRAIQNNCVFRGKQNEDPTSHLMDFDEIMNTFHYNGASHDAIYLREFPFSLKDDAKILTLKEAIEIQNELADDANQWVLENSEKKKTAGVHQVDTYNTLQALIAAIVKDVKQLTLAQAQMTQLIMCDFCAGSHPTHECQHGSFIEEQNNVRGQGQTLRERPPGNLPSDTIRNPKELKIVTWRSGKKLNNNNKSKSCEVTKSQDEKQGSKNVVGKSNEIQKGNEKLELEIDYKYMPAFPFSQKMKRDKLDKYFGKFLEMLKQLHVNIPFTEWEDQFTIIPEGIVEDVLVRVDKFVFPVDFIMMDMEENKEVPLILGRPFLDTGRAILDVYEGKLMLRFGEENVVFNMKKVDELIVKTTMSDRKITTWVRAFGQACTMDPDTVFDTD
ncbi:hypothetical protein KY289_001705 [Solanum tuberosum]|nr:hypothetical protein KY289_001705 [Solanum tuberosum]